MNLTRALSEHTDAEIAETRAQAQDALAAYIAARRRILELEILREVRQELAVADAQPTAPPLSLATSHAHAGGR